MNNKDANKETRTVVDPAELVVCPSCGGTFPILRDERNEPVVVQPFPVQAFAPFRGLIHTKRAIPPNAALKKALEGKMAVRKMPPVFVPHAYCCAGGDGIPPLFMPLPSQQGERENEESQDSEGKNPQPPAQMENDQPDGSDVIVRLHEAGGEDR